MRLQTAHTGRSEVDAHGNSRKISIRPKAKRYTSETLPDRDLLILSMMTLWRADVWWYHDALDEAVIGRIFSTSVSIYSMPMDPAVRWSLARTFRYLMESIVQCPVDSPRRPLLLTWVTETGYVGLRCGDYTVLSFAPRPAVLASVATNLLSVRTDLQTQRMLMQHAYEIMYRYASAEKVRPFVLPLTM